MIAVNPGTGYVPNATLENAVSNMKHWLVDCDLKNHKFIYEPENDVNDGRFSFIVLEIGDNEGVFHRIQMPGLPLEEVRYVGSENQNVWHFPRLYVDGSSWVWKFSLLKKSDFSVAQLREHAEEQADE